MKGWAQPEDGSAPSATRRAPFVRSLSAYPTVLDFGSELARSPLSSRLLGRLPRRRPAGANSSLAGGSLVGRPTGMDEPLAGYERAPTVPMAGSPDCGWERSSSLVGARSSGPVRWGRAESPALSLSETLNGSPPLSGIGLTDEALLSAIERSHEAFPLREPRYARGLAPPRGATARTPRMVSGRCVASCSRMHPSTATRAVGRLWPEWEGRGASDCPYGHANRPSGRHRLAKPHPKAAPA